MENFFSYLNVAIGVSFIYMILSLLISEVQENLTALLELRAVSLRGSLINLLEGKANHNNPEKAEIMQALYDTSLLKSLNQGKKHSKGPSYIPKEIFSAALLEVLQTRYQLDINNQDNIDDIANKIDNKLQAYQRNSGGQTDLNQLYQNSFVPVGDVVNPLSGNDINPEQLTNDLDIPMTASGMQTIPQDLEATPIREDLSISAWNDPSLEQPIVSSEIIIPPDNIQPILNLPQEQNIDTLIQISPPPKSNISKQDDGEKDSDIYFLSNLSTLAHRIQDKVDDKEVKLVEFQKGVAEWFDQSMVRASGVYKRNSKGVSFCIGLIVAILGNIDTINMVDRLYKNQSLSGTVNQLANQVVENNSQSITTLNAANTLEEKNNAIQPIRDNINVVIDQIAAFPIGWTLPRDVNISPLAWISRLAGWFVSAIAFSMGAPFWFELLNKFINVRNTGQRPKTGEPDAPNSQT